MPSNLFSRQESDPTLQYRMNSNIPKKQAMDESQSTMLIVGEENIKFPRNSWHLAANPVANGLGRVSKPEP